MKVEKLAEVVYQPSAECSVCTWKVSESAVTRDRAKIHVRETGHKVRVVVEKVALWGPG